MSNILFSAFLVILGLILGIIIMFIINIVRRNSASDKASNVLDKANREAENIKKKK